MVVPLWDYARRYRNRIAAGATIVGGIYVAKKIWESDVFAELVRSLQAHAADHSAQPAVASASTDHTDGHSRRVEARRSFVFDAHQQSCDKTLARILPSVERRINERFNTDELVEKLKAGGGALGAEEKLSTWESLRNRGVCKLLAIAYAYPLLVLAFKSQRSIVCSEICRQMEAAQREREAAVLAAEHSSLAAQALNRLSAFFWKPDEEGSEEMDADNASSSKVQLDARTQQMFNNCAHYLMTEGLEQLFSLIERVAQPIVGSEMTLGRSVTSTDIREILGRICEEIDCRLFATHHKGLRELIVPAYALPPTADMTYLQELLSRLANAVSQRWGLLLRCLTAKYLDDYTQAKITTTDGMPVAKHIPIVVDACGRISRTKADSVFQRTLILPELFHFTSMIFHADAEESLLNPTEE